MSVERYIEGEIACGLLGADGVPGHPLPGDRPQWPRDRIADIRHSKIDVRIDVPGQGISGTVTHTLVAMNPGLHTVSLDAVDMQIGNVMVGGKPVEFGYDGEQISIPLDPPRDRGQEFRVAVTYAATPRVGLYFTGPDDGYPEKPVQAWTQGQDEDSKYWFPCLDSPNGKQTTDLLATVPGHWFVLSNGRLLENKENRDGTRRYHWHQDRPHSTYLISMAAGEFERIEANRNDLTIDYYVEEKDVDSAIRTFKNTPEMVELFEKVSGIPYPWAKYSQIVVRDFVFGGMENTSATTMTELILLDRKAERDFTSDGLISHELAHMWWGDLLTCREWAHGWLNEGFATYMECLWTEHHRGIDEYHQEVLDNTALYLAEEYRRPLVANVYNEPIDVFDRHLYEKGSLVLHMLRQELGDEAFYRSLQLYTRDNQDRNVVTRDLVRAISEETGRNLDWFFDQWVFKPGHPKFKVSWSWDNDRKVATVSVKQTQDTTDGTPVFQTPVRIGFRTGRGRPQEFQVRIESEEESFSFALPRKPDLCRFDPYGAVLKELEFDKPAKELVFQLQNDDDIGGREAAARALGKKGGATAVEALATAMTGDRFWGVQAAAARALGKAGTADAKAALIAAIGIRHPKTRRGIVEALGNFHDDEEAREALIPLSRRDQSWFVEGEANRSLGKLRVAGAYEAIMANIDRPSFRQVVRIGCIDGLVELRDERAVEQVLRVAKYGEPFQARPVAMRALGQLANRFESRRTEICDVLVDYLRDPDFRVRIAAANALKRAGDGSRAPALDEMRERELDGRGIRVARQVSAALRSGDTVPGEVRKLRDELEELRREHQKLTEKLESSRPRRS